MGTPKGNPKGLTLFPSGGVFADVGAGVVQASGCDAQNDQIRVWGRFTIDAGGDPDDISGTGITSVTGGAGSALTGIYTVTFDEGFQTMQMGSCTVMAATSGVGTDTIGEVSAFTAGAAGACTLRLLVFTGAAAADVATGDYVCFDAVLTSQWLDS
jgi:hypothetical protein